jgi:predicted RNase H-like HicB family nuclease
MQLKLLITPTPEGGYFGSVPAIPGAFSQAETIAELQVNIKEVIELLQEVRLEKAAGELKNPQIQILLV